MNFENITVRLHVIYILNMYIKFHSNRMLFRLYVIYILNMYIKFHSNRMLFTIWLINFFLLHNFLLHSLHINWFFSLNFASIKIYNKNMNLTIRFSKFISNKKYIEGIVLCVFNTNGPCYLSWSPIKPKHNVMNEEL